MSKQKILSVNHLKTDFLTQEGRVRAIHDLSFDLNQQEIIGIVGESGCGKSVTSLSIMRLLPKKTGIIADGTILFEGKNLLDFSEDEMRHVRGKEIAMIFQEPMTSLNPVFTIGRQIGEMFEIHTNLSKDEIRTRSIDLLKQVKIPRAEEIIDNFPHQLSGGMRQRVMIAMAIACQPKILIADEPTTALDVTIQAQILNLLKELNESMHMSIMFITHDLGVIGEMADRVLVLYAGQVVEEAPVEALFNQPIHYYTQGLLASRPALLDYDDDLHCIAGNVPSLQEIPPGCAFEPRCDYSCEICRLKKPELLEIQPGHFARCWVQQEKYQVQPRSAGTE